jgi:hypothetical protein
VSNKLPQYLRGFHSSDSALAEHGTGQKDMGLAPHNGFGVENIRGSSLDTYL